VLSIRVMAKFNRFTTLPVLLDMLTRKKLVLLDPCTWEDKNDSEVVAEYKKRKKLRSLFALCGSKGDETIHHWKTFADGISGCCVEFDLKKLEVVLKRLDGVRFGSVVYKRFKDLTAVTDRSISVDQMPFTKRWPYRCEEEYRIIWESLSAAKRFEIDFDPRIINRITISQRMPEPIYETIRAALQESVKDPGKRINRSTIYENRVWIGKFTKA
jgi:hypothetical protein